MVGRGAWGRDDIARILAVCDRALCPGLAPPHGLTLDGTHRFARHEMAFALDEREPSDTELSVITRAAFPGPVGRIYRGLVIGSGGHVLATLRLLKAVKREAES